MRPFNSFEFNRLFKNEVAKEETEERRHDTNHAITVAALIKQLQSMPGDYCVYVDNLPSKTANVVDPIGTATIETFDGVRIVLLWHRENIG